MSDAQKYQKKKNLLIILFLILLVVFVCLICGILIYAKNNPPQQFKSPDEIEILQMQAVDYPEPTNPKYKIITEPNSFDVTENEQELQLVLTNTKEIKLSKNGVEEPIKIMLNETDINNNIKLIYQTQKDSLILTQTGELYRLIHTNIENGALKAGKILANMEVKEIVKMSKITASTYILNGENKLINIDNLKEYSGIIEEIKTDTATIYVYENEYFGLEEGKMFVDKNNQGIRIKISFDDKIIALNDTIYEINTTDKTLSTSKLGEFREVGRREDPETKAVKLSLLTTTGFYELNSSYYYEN